MFYIKLELILGDFSGEMYRQTQTVPSLQKWAINRKNPMSYLSARGTTQKQKLRNIQITIQTEHSTCFGQTKLDSPNCLLQG